MSCPLSWFTLNVSGWVDGYNIEQVVSNNENSLLWRDIWFDGGVFLDKFQRFFDLLE